MTAITPDKDERKDIERCENGVILNLHRISGATHRLTKLLVLGRIESEIVGAVADLRKAANELERINKEWP